MFEFLPGPQLNLMDLELTETQLGARDTARRFAHEKLERVGVEVDRTHEFPKAAIAEFTELRWITIQSEPGHYPI